MELLGLLDLLVKLVITETLALLGQIVLLLVRRAQIALLLDLLVLLAQIAP